MPDNYGLVEWWLSTNTYDKDVKVENTFDKTQDDFRDNIFKDVMLHAKNKSRSDKQKDTLKYLEKSHDKFIREHKSKIEGDNSFMITVSDAFKKEVEDKTLENLRKYELEKSEKNEIVNALKQDYEDLKLSQISKKTDQEVMNLIRERVVISPTLKEASEDVLGESISEKELKQLYHTDRSNFVKIHNRMRALR